MLWMVQYCTVNTTLHVQKSSEVLRTREQLFQGELFLSVVFFEALDWYVVYISKVSSSVYMT